jgi:hypothetical protein
MNHGHAETGSGKKIPEKACRGESRGSSPALPAPRRTGGSRSSGKKLDSRNKRAVFCYFCGKSWPHDGMEPPIEILKEALQHEQTCEKNPYLVEIEGLRAFRDRIRDREETGEGGRREAGLSALLHL